MGKWSEGFKLKIKLINGDNRWSETSGRFHDLILDLQIWYWLELRNAIELIRASQANNDSAEVYDYFIQLNFQELDGYKTFSNKS